MALRASSIERYKSAFPATKPELAERLGVTIGRAQQIVDALKEAKLVEESGHTINGAGGLVQRFALVGQPAPENNLDIKDKP
jgi:hypothetical protein